MHQYNICPQKQSCAGAPQTIAGQHINGMLLAPAAHAQWFCTPVAHIPNALVTTTVEPWLPIAGTSHCGLEANIEIKTGFQSQGTRINIAASWQWHTELRECCYTCS